MNEIQEKNVKRNNLILALVLGACAVAGVLLPFWYLPKLFSGG